ncbi:germ cell nuclear acidic protein [Octopus bimaculoides]|uniref:SprT-like domain-containing protein n=1 Tax=Octopus bimaculoides TaxID=37653 RepID=A0A0L8I9K9_OCTBM|nr:germ cell nuclear acidic protein [Octopus bimaculoides]|eukprot:XP_014783893.1 PREDICTED: uncharacterized protein LOC106879010 [Octopus bimaculoides]
MSLNDVDIDEMFLQMSEKLGWLQLGDVDSAIRSLTKRQKHKESAKKGSTAKDISASSKNSITANTAATTSKVKKSKPSTKKQGVSGKSDVRSNGDCNNGAIKVGSNHKENMKADLLDKTGAKSLGKIHVGLESQPEKDLFLATSTLEFLDSPDLVMSSTGYNDIDDDDDKIGRDKRSLVTSVFSQPPKPDSPSCRHSDDSNSNSLNSPLNLFGSDDFPSMTGICKKISFVFDDSTSESSFNDSDSASDTSNNSCIIEKTPLTTTTIQTPPTVAETAKMSEIPTMDDWDDIFQYFTPSPPDRQLPKLETKIGKNGLSGGGGDDGVFRKPSVFPGTNTNSSTGSKSTVTRLKTPVSDKRSTPVNNVLPNVPCGGKVPQTCPTQRYLLQPRPPHKTNKQREADGYACFLKSLSENAENLSYVDEEARKFVKYFKKFRVQLVKKLFVIYNETIFDNQFPADLPIVWNKRLLTTAGHCKLKKKTNTLRKTQVRTVEVNLATKVCDTAERVRDTLIHELCHAAVWLFNGSQGGHGVLWKSWARRANRRYPSALAIIERCHSYNIAKKYTYKCVQCGYSFGRHSKSLDTTKKVCGYCHGRFELVTAADSTRGSNKGGSEMTPARTPNKFALFVKEHYGTVKKSSSCSHKDVMNILSQKFKEARIS